MNRLCNRVFAPSSRTILATKDCLFPIESRGCLTRLRSSSCLINSSQRCNHTKYSPKVATWWARSNRLCSVCSVFSMFLMFFFTNVYKLDTYYTEILYTMNPYNLHSIDHPLHRAI